MNDYENNMPPPDWSLPPGCLGLIFDCDGTLVDSMPLHYRAWITVLKKYDMTFPEDQFYRLAGVPTEPIVRILAKEQGVSVDATALARERDAFFHSMPAGDFRPVNMVVEIARRYHRQIPMAVATGSTKISAESSLRAIGILEWFDAVVSSLDVGHPKPAPDVFLAAAKRIGVEPQACVAFEDADAGIASAQAAGMQVVDIRPWLVR